LTRERLQTEKTRKSSTKTLKAENEALTSAHDHIGKEGGIVKKFTDRQEKALTVLINEPSVAEASRALGVHRSTLFNYLANPDFKAELNRRKAEQLQEGAAELRAGVKDSVKVLKWIITKKEASDQVRINAINTLLTHAERFAELVDLEEQLQEISERQNEIDRRHNGGI
jgi:hypothetical protein